MIPELLNHHLQTTNEQRDDENIHPSSLSGCYRQYYYQLISGFKKPLEGKDLRVFANGTSLHERFQAWFDKMGILEGNWKDKEVEFISIPNKWFGKRPNSQVAFLEPSIMSEEYNIKGHCDGILDINSKKYLVELKSINTFGFKVLKEPKDNHLIQASIYAYFMGLDDIVFIYEDKNDQNLKEFIVRLNINFVESHLKQIKDLQEAVKCKSPPDRVCQTPSDKLAKYCPFVSVCFAKKFGLENIL